MDAAIQIAGFRGHIWQPRMAIVRRRILRTRVNFTLRTQLLLLEVGRSSVAAAVAGGVSDGQW